MSADDPQREEAEAGRAIRRSAARKQRARRVRRRSALHGLGLFGLVGWAVALPTLLGVALGLWIDSRSDTAMSWTLAMLLAGVALGCLNAWYWVQRESRDD